MTCFHSFNLIAEATLWMRFYPVCNRSLPLCNKRFGNSAVPSNPRWLRPPEPPSAPIVSPLALWSRKGIGFTLVLLATFTCCRSVARRFEYMYNCFMYILLHTICHSYPVSVPQPCLYPTLPLNTIVSSVVPGCERAYLHPT